MVGLRWSGRYNGSDVVFGVLRRLLVMVWILRWLDCGGQGTTMVGLGPSGYDNGLAAVVMVLRWLDCGGEGTTMVGLGRSGYYDGLAAVVMALRWLDCGGDGATMAGLQWR